MIATVFSYKVANKVGWKFLASCKFCCKATRDFGSIHQPPVTMTTDIRHHIQFRVSSLQETRSRITSQKSTLIKIVCNI